MSVREPDIFIYSVPNLIDLVVLISQLISENIVTRQDYKKHYNIIPVESWLRLKTEESACPSMCQRSLKKRIQGCWYKAARYSAICGCFEKWVAL